MLSAYIPPTSCTLQPGSTVKKRETSPRSMKKISSFIHFNRQKQLKEAEQYLRDQALEQSRKEEAVRRQQEEDRNYLQNISDEINDLKRRKADLELLRAKEFSELQRHLTSSSSSNRAPHHHQQQQQQHSSQRHQSHHYESSSGQQQSNLARGAHEHNSQMHHLNHRTRSPGNSGSSHGSATRVTNGTRGSQSNLDYPGTQFSQHSNPHPQSQSMHMGANTHTLHHTMSPGGNPSHLEVTPTSGVRKRNRSRSPSPQLVKMYSQGTRSTTPRGSSMSPVAHAVASMNLPPGVTHSQVRGIYDANQAHYNATAAATLANFQNATAQQASAVGQQGGNSRYPGNPQLHGSSVEQHLSASQYGRHHAHSANLAGQAVAAAQQQSAVAAAAFHQQHGGRPNLSQYSVSSRDHGNVHGGNNINLGNPANNVSSHLHLKGRWPTGPGGYGLS
ncbi:signal transducer and activator of transcription C-like [Symsagittifera roscoffensis]|uniref:signal transducer and activator of transcription C-like n=1 Tax=Symsagittifera roscoffensis TaxID=84072 RepID=UPI00307B3F2C